LYVCADYSLSDRRIPAGCDWYGARGLRRIDVQVALGEALLLALALLALWVRTLRHGVLATVSLTVAVAGLTVGVFGTAADRS
jgi:hypothetical protein